MLKPKKSINGPAIQTGSVLVAKPFWKDNRYNKSVILITEHNEDGSCGVIINKETDASLNIEMQDVNISFPVYYGGPFDKKEIVSLHSKPKITGSEPIANGISIGSGYDVLTQMVNAGKKIDITKVRFFSGHVNWAGGELEQEITDGKWWTSHINGKELFNVKANSLWSGKLLSDGHMYGMFANVPEPSLN